METVVRWILCGVILVAVIALQVWVDTSSVQTRRWKPLKRWWNRKE